MNDSQHFFQFRNPTEMNVFSALLANVNFWFAKAVVLLVG
jgi:hypothetical protein